MFFNKNYIAFPGVTESGTYVLNSLFKAIFIVDRDWKTLPDNFQSRVYDGATLMLNMFHTTAIRSGLKRNYYKDGNNDFIEFPPEENISAFKLAVTFNEEWISARSKEWNIDATIINEFTCTPQDKFLQEEYRGHSYIDIRPLIKINNEYIVIQPISCVESLIDFIWIEAKKHDCYDALLKLQHEVQWRDLHPLFYKTQWGPISAVLPSSTGIGCKEMVLKFDINKVVYVCFLESGLSDTTSSNGLEGYNKPQEDIVCFGNAISARRNIILNFLKKTESLESKNILALYIVSGSDFHNNSHYNHRKRANYVFGFVAVNLNA